MSALINMLASRQRWRRGGATVGSFQSWAAQLAAGLAATGMPLDPQSPEAVGWAALKPCKLQRAGLHNHLEWHGMRLFLCVVSELLPQGRCGRNLPPEAH